VSTQNEPGKKRHKNSLLKITNMKAFKQHIHQNSLVSFRRRWGLTQQQVAEHMQLSRSTVGMIEQGRRAVPINTLLQLAHLEIKMASRKDEEEIKTIYADPEAIVSRCKRHCDQLAMRELYCQGKVDKLKEKLKTMTSLYQKTSEWMKVVQLHIKEEGDDKELLNTWRKHELTARRTLGSCGLPAQMLLKHTIDFHTEEVELHKNKQLQIKLELAGILLPAQ